MVGLYVKYLSQKGRGESLLLPRFNLRSSSGCIGFLPARSNRAVDELNHIGVRSGCDCRTTRRVLRDCSAGALAPDIGVFVEAGDEVAIELIVAVPRQGSRRMAAPVLTAALHDDRRALLGGDMCPRPRWQRGYELS